jgi:sugar O-acyltransferase (sialic acid O-acetyltransferase NeuD family)
MLKPIIFWGATGQARVLREFIGSTGYELVALFDNNQSASSPFAEIPLFYGIVGFMSWKQSCSHANVAGLVAIGGSSGQARLEIQRFLEQQGIQPARAVHPTAFVASSAVLGPGSQVLAQAAVCADARLGAACIVNTKASVDHETTLGDGVHVAPGATIAGCVTVGDDTLIGAGAIILPRIRIGRHVIVGAGAVVTKDVPDGTVVYGNPARIQRDTSI